MGDHKCDVPVSLEESMYRAIKELVPDAAFSIFTGDIVDHAVWNTSQLYNSLASMYCPSDTLPEVHVYLSPP